MRATQLRVNLTIILTNNPLRPTLFIWIKQRGNFMMSAPARPFLTLLFSLVFLLGFNPADAVEKNGLQAVVSIKATVPPDARTARF